jgi:hypothetical protein
MTDLFHQGATYKTVYHIRWEMQDRELICGKAVSVSNRAMLVDGSVEPLYYYYGDSYMGMRNETPPVLPNMKWCERCEEGVPWKVLATYGENTHMV